MNTLKPSTRQTEPDGYDHGWYDGYANEQPASDDRDYMQGWLHGQSEFFGDMDL